MLKMLKRSSRILCSLLVAMIFIAMATSSVEAGYWYTHVSMNEQKQSTKYTLVYGIKYSGYSSEIEGECFKGKTKICLQYYDSETGKYNDYIPSITKLSAGKYTKFTCTLYGSECLVRGKVSADNLFYPYDAGSVAIKIEKP